MKNIVYFFAVSIVGLLLVSFFTLKKKQNKGYEVVVPYLDIPWGFTFLPDNSMLITTIQSEFTTDLDH